MMVGFSLSVSAQKNDPDKKPAPKDNPPVVKPGDKPPKERPPDDRNNDNRPKKPEMALIKTADGKDILFV